MQKNVEKMIINYSPNFDLKKRNKNKIKYLIYHYTGMKNDKSAIKKLTSLFGYVYGINLLVTDREISLWLKTLRVGRDLVRE